MDERKKQPEVRDPNTDEDQRIHIPEEFPDGAYGMPERRNDGQPTNSEGAGIDKLRQPDS